MMKNFESTFRLFAAAFLTLVCAAFAAAAPQVFVSSKGIDTNPCDRNAPCATFAAAVNQVDAGGEVIVLDSGSYGAVTITKAMQIVAPAGVDASILNSGGTAVTIAAGTADLVVLRGLTISGYNTYAINFDSGAALSVENCQIINSYIGIVFDAPGKLFVKDSVLRKNNYGVYVYAPSGGVQAAISRTTTENGSYGMYVYGNPQVSITDSVSSGNIYDGFYITGSNGKTTITGSTAANNGRWGFAATGGLPTLMTLDGCTATGNLDAGIYVGGGGNPGGLYGRVSNTVSTGNKYGFYNLGHLESYGNNRVRGNTTDIYGTITTVSQN